MGAAEAVARIDITGGTATARRTHVAEFGDGALVDAYVDGDQRAFAALYERYHDRLLAFCRQRTRTPQIAEDLAHDVMVRAITYLEGFDRDRPMWPWLKQIARNELADHYRATARETDVTPDALPDEDPTANEHTVWLPERHHLTQAMQCLSPRDRSVLTLKYCNDWDSAQLGDFFDVGRPALYKLLQRARDRLLDAYEELADSKLAGLLPVPLITRLQALTDRVRARLTGTEGFAVAPGCLEAFVSAAAALAIGVGLSAVTTAYASQDPLAQRDSQQAARLTPDMHAESVTFHSPSEDLISSDATETGPAAVSSFDGGRSADPGEAPFSAAVSSPPTGSGAGPAVHAAIQGGQGEGDSISVANEAEAHVGEMDVVGNDRDVVINCQETELGRAVCESYDSVDDELSGTSK